MADATGSNDSSHSLGEYNGVIEQAGVSKFGNAADLAIVLFWGRSAQKDRERRKANKKAKDKSKESN